MLGAPALFCIAVVAGGVPQTAPQPSPAAPPIAIDVVTLPSSVRLGPAELTVSVDGRPRKVISIRPILRGPGSERAAADALPGGASPIAEPSRTIIIAVDQSSMMRGSEKKTSAMIARVLDLIGPADRAALIPLPIARTASVAVTTDRRALWSALGKIRVGGAAAPLALARAEEPTPLPDDETHEIRNPSNEDRVPERERRPEPVRPPESREQPDEDRYHVLRDMRALFTAMQGIPGNKTILLVRGTDAPEPESREPFADAARLESAGLLQAATVARATIHIVTLGDRWRSSGDEAARVARLTGGDEFRLGKQADKELARLGASMTEGLRVAIEGAQDDLDARVHQVAVTTSRRDVAVRAPERWLPFEAHEPMRMPAAQPAMATATISAPPGERQTTSTLAVDPELQHVLARMSAYVTDYVQEFTAVVAEETYEQRLTTTRDLRGLSRKLRSDFLLVRIPGQDEWMPFRDVFEVNGKPIRDRDDRLRKLFIEMPPDALDKARRILDEGARYNIGSMYRNINQPVLPLVFLMPQFVRNLQFRRGGDDTIEGVRAWQIEFEEIGRPTVIRNDKANRDIPARGSLWVDPVTGRILKTRIRMQDATLKMDTTVLYQRSDALHLWAPVEMSERYITADEKLDGSAKYKNFRRFRVDVEEKIAIPKG